MYPMSINAQEENVASPQDSVPSIVELPLNKVQPIDLKRNVRDVIVANPEVADVIIKTQTQSLHHRSNDRGYRYTFRR